MASTILGAGRAPGKVILFGEHAVVYGRPALAVPVTQVWAEATVEAGAPGAGLVIWAADLGQEIVVRTAPADQPLAAAVRLALERLRLLSRSASSVGDRPEQSDEPDWRITVRSTIPIASGMGSGAAVSAAIVRAVVEAANCKLQIANQQASKSANDEMVSRQYVVRTTHYAITPAALSALIYEVEKLHHGTPSGVDNTVIAFGQPVYFVRGQAPQPFAIGKPFTLVIADTGIRSPTRIAVGDVRRAWERERPRFEALFDRIAAVVEAARGAIADGTPTKLGPLMDESHALLGKIGVSCPELDALGAAARAAGALGAKLSGAGRGGNLIALVTDETAPPVAEALTAAGAVRVIVTRVGAAGWNMTTNSPD